MREYLILMTDLSWNNLQRAVVHAYSLVEAVTAATNLYGDDHVLISASLVRDERQ